MDSSNIYAVPLDYHVQGLDAEVLDVFGLTERRAGSGLDALEEISHRAEQPRRRGQYRRGGQVHRPDRRL